MRSEKHELACPHNARIELNGAHSRDYRLHPAVTCRVGCLSPSSARFGDILSRSGALALFRIDAQFRAIKSPGNRALVNVNAPVRA